MNNWNNIKKNLKLVSCISIMKSFLIFQYFLLWLTLFCLTNTVNILSSCMCFQQKNIWTKTKYFRAKILLYFLDDIFLCVSQLFEEKINLILCDLFLLFGFNQSPSSSLGLSTVNVDSLGSIVLHEIRITFIYVPFSSFLVKKVGYIVLTNRRYLYVFLYAVLELDKKNDKSIFYLSDYITDCLYLQQYLVDLIFLILFPALKSGNSLRNKCFLVDISFNCDNWYNYQWYMTV